MKKKQKTQVAQRVIIFNSVGEILTMRRSKTAPSRPLHWDFPGGVLEFGEDLIKGIAREVKEEAGLKVKKFEFMDAASGFNDNEEFWVTICYVAFVSKPKIVLSYEHDCYLWIKPQKFQTLKSSPRNREFLRRVLKSKFFHDK